MNKISGILSLIFILASISINAQVYNNPGSTVTDCSGTFFDTGGATGSYANSEEITTTFCSSNGGTISLNFTSFGLENSSDFLQAFDGADVTGTPFHTGNGWTGTTGPGLLTSTGTCITFFFDADFSITNIGWVATISCGAPPPEFANPGGTINTCNATFTDTGGAAATYANNENVTTTICSDNGEVVNVNFSAFNTQNNNDVLSVYDGSIVDPVNLIGNFSGTTSPGALTSTGTCLTFDWVSDANQTAAGWEATISCGYPVIIINNPGTSLGMPIEACEGGTFFDSGGAAGNYSNFEAITTTICPDVAGECLTANFVSFETESLTADNLEIFDGLTTASPSLGVYGGTLSPGVVTATNGCLTFRFTSDFSVVEGGWEAELSCNTCGVVVCTGTTPPCFPLIPDSCDDACDLGTLATPAGCPTGGAVSNTFCLSNVGATAENPYSTLVGCEDGTDMASPAADVWYSFVATANQTTINIAGLNNPSLGIYEGSTCGSIIGRGCDNGVGSLSLIVDPTNPGVTYFLQISGGDETDVGDIELEIVSTWNCDNCLTSSIITTTPTPVNGQFQAGQTVEFCFTVNSWSNTASNWIHSVVPYPGAAWDISSITPTSAANSCDGAGNWAWYNSITGTNPSSANVGTVGPGFAFDTNNDGSFFPIPIDGNPGNNFGDSGGSCPTGDVWTFCWEITVNDCPPNSTGDDLSMTVETYGDSETGAWNNPACQSDPVSVSFTSIACCSEPTIVIDETTCPNQCTGEATVTGVGTGPYDYAWGDDTGATIQTTSGVAGSNQATALCGGTYTVTVTDTNDGCVRTIDVVISEDTPPTVAITPATPNFCPDGSVDLTGTGASGSGSGYMYNWEQPDASTVAGAMISASQIGTYIVTITDDNGCTGTNNVVVGEFTSPSPTITINEMSGSFNDDGVLCIGDPAELDPGTWVSYIWSEGDVSQTITVTDAGSYTVTITDTNGCTATAVATIATNPLPTPSIIVTDMSGNTDDDGTICLGDNATLDAGVGYTSYLWSEGDATQMLTVTTAGLYTVTVTDANGCQGIANTTIVVNALPAPMITVTDNSGTTVDDGIICTGGSATLSTGTFTSYEWSTGDITQSTTVTTGGDHTVTVTDGNGCEATATFNVTENPLPMPSITITETSGTNDDGVICIGDDAILDAGTFSSYSWSTGDMVQMITVTTAGDYTVVVTDGNGCTATAVATIATNPLPTPSIIVTDMSGNTDDDGTICLGDNATLDAGVGYTSYLWSEGDATQMLTVTTAGLYTVTVTDANGCQGIANTTIVVNALPTPTITVTDNSGTTDDDGIICTGGTATLDAGMFSSYQWSTGDITQSTTVTTGGDHTVTVTDGNGCEATATFNVTENPLPMPSITITETSGTNDDGVICIGDDAILDAGTFSSYSWSTGDMVQMITVTTAGDYTVVVTDGNGCTATAVATIATNPLPTPSIIVTDMSGNTDDDGTICLGDNATLDAGVGYTSYLWSEGDATQMLTVTTAGLYTVTVTDANGCQGIANTTIVVNALPTPTITVTDNSGTTDDDGIICTGGTATLDAGMFSSYEWSTGDITQSTTVTTGGDHTVTVTDGNGCEATATFNVTENPLPMPSITITETSGTNDDGVICIGDDAILDAGTFSSYSWSTGDMVQMITATTAGDYTVVVTDGNGCTASAVVTIATNPLPTPSIIVTDMSGNTDDDGTICLGDNATLDAGVGYTSYLWSEGDATQMLTVTTAGLYTVTVTDANGCQGIANTTIVVNALPTPTITVTDNSGTTDDDGIICTGGTATLDAGMFSSYQWSTGDITQSTTVTTGGDYTVVVTDGNGCEASATFTVTENPLPTPSIAITETSGTNDDGVICEGDDAMLDAGTFDSYTWSTGEMTQVITVTTAGDYTVEVTDGNGCSATAVVTIATNPLPTPTITVTDMSGILADDGIICIGADATLDAGIGFTGYEWSAGDLTQTLTVTTAGLYSVTVTDANGCEGVANITIVVNPLPMPVITAADNSGSVIDDGIICTGGTATLDAGVFSSYQWSTGDITQSTTVTTGGDYTVVVTDGNGCEASATFTVTENPLPTPSIAITETSGTNDDGVICEGDDAMLDAGTYDSYTWSTGEMTQVITVTTAGDYTVEVTDGNGCSATVVATISTNPLPTPTITVTDMSGILADDGIICIGADATLDAGIGFTGYEWSAGDLTQTLTVTTAGLYSVTVTDANGCEGVANITIVVNPLPVPVITAADNSGSVIDDGIICTGGTATLDAGVFSSYQWSTGDITQSTTVTTGGDYTVVVTDGNGCEASATFTVTENPLPTPSIAITETSGTNDDGVICEGDDAMLDAGTYDSYTWSTGEMTQVITVTTAGDYTVEVTDGNGCSATVVATISTNPLPTPTITVTDMSGILADDGIICIGADATLDAGIGFTGYEWSAGDLTQTLTVTTAGLYSVTVTDANGCEGVANITIVVNPLPMPVITAADNSGSVIDDGIICTGGTATLDAGMFSSYQWSTGDITQSTTVTTGGDYTVVVTDGNGCEASATFTVIENPLPTPSIAITETSGTNDDGVICEGDDAMLDAGTYDSYTWSTGEMTQVITVTTAGDYTVEVTDGNGCSATAVATISTNPLPTPTITVTENSGILPDDGIVCEGDEVVLDAGSYTSYVWESGELTQTITVTTAGMYTVSVTDANGCVGVTTTTVVVNPLPTPMVSITDNSGTTIDDGIVCEGDNAVLSAGNFSEYEWSTGDMTESITVIVSGTFTVTVTDGNGCIATSEGTVIVNPLPTPTITITESSGLVNDDGIICDGDMATLDAGMYTSYLWDDGSVLQTLVVGAAGDYTVTVTDANGCIATATTTITVNPLAPPTITVAETSGNMNDDGILCEGDEAILSAGTYTAYEWSTGAITPTLTVTTSDTYTVSVTNGNGCEETATIVIVVNPLPTPMVSVTDNSGNTIDDGIICQGDDAVLSAGTFSEYEWSTGDMTESITVTTSGTFTVTVSDGNGCTATSEGTVIVNPLPTPIITITESSGLVNDDGIICDGDMATLDAGMYTSYLWDDGSVLQTLVVGAAGDYTVTVTDANGCIATTTTTITVNPLAPPTITAAETSGNMNDDGILCEGDEAILSAGTYTAYEWSTGAITPTLTVTTSDTYTVSVTNGNGCEETATMVIVVNPLPTPTVTVTDNSGNTIDDGIICGGDDAVLSAGTFSEYEWSTGDMTESITVTTSGTFTVTVSDGNGCTATSEGTVIVNPLPTPIIAITESSGLINDDGIICDGDMATLDAGIYTSYLWDDGSVLQTLTVGLAGDYTVTVTDANGCIATATTTITVNPLAPPTITVAETSGNMNDDGILCEGDEAILSAGTYTAYEWSTGAITPTLTVTIAGTYTVSVTNGNGCEETATTVIVVNPLPTPTIAVTETSGTTADDGIICTGDDAVLDAGTFSEYLWSTGEITGTITVTAGGTYTVVVTDGNGCEASATTTITENPLPTPTITVAETSGNINNDGLICVGDDATLDAGIYDSYTWSTGASTQTIVVTTSGDYSVTVMDSNGCFGEAVITIIENPLPTPVITITDMSGSMNDDGVLCAGDEATLDAGPYTSFLWADGEVSQTIMVTAAGDYFVTVTDANGCIGTAMATIVVNPLPTPTIAVTETSGTTADDGIICFGDDAVLDAGTFSEYLWSTGEITGTITVTAGGTYTVVVTDGNGCEASATTTITENPLPTPTITVAETSGNINNDGLICVGDDATLDAGIYDSYTWSTGASTQTIIVTTSGDYTVTVMDSNGCFGETVITIVENPLPTPAITITDMSGSTNDDGIICAGDEAVLNAGSYTSFLWGDGEVSQTITVTAAGDYFVTVTDANGCVGVTMATVVVNPLPTPTIAVTETSGTTADDGIICFGDDAVLDAGTFSEYLWSTGEITGTITVTAGGTYTVVVTDGNGCEASATTTITENPLPIPTITVIETSGTINNDGIICTGDDATLDAGSYDGYLWSTGETTQTIVVTTGGDYSVTVMDSNGCFGEGMITITENPLPTPTVTITETSGSFNDDGTICEGDDAVLDAGPYTSFLWSTGSVSQTITVTVAGDYTVTITDANGCIGTAMTTIVVNPLPVPTIELLEMSGVADNDGIICEGDVVTLNTIGLFSTYAWSTGDGTVTTTVTVAGDYTVTVTDGNGCIGTAVATVIANPLPTPTITVTENSGTVNNDGIICTGDDAVLDAGTFVSYVWSTGELTQTITVTDGGDYTVTTTDMNGCAGTGVITIIENPLPTPAITITETSGSFDNDGILCIGDNALLDAGVYTSYLWDNGEITQTISVDMAGDYTVIVTDVNGCEASATTIILVNPLPTPIIDVLETSGSVDNDGIICDGDLVSLTTSTSFSTYEWSTGGMGQAIDITTGGDFTVTVTDGNGCQATATVTITANPSPTPVITVTETSGTTDNDGIICTGDQAMLDAGTFISYVWSTGELTQTIDVITAGDYSVTVTSANGCTGIAVITIVENPLPTPTITITETSGSFNDDGVICMGDDAVLDAGSYVSYVWDSGEIVQAITVTTAGDYTVTVTDINGCDAVATVNIVVNPVPTPVLTIAETSGIANNDGTICEGDIATISTIGNYSTYIWSTGGMGQSIDVTTGGDFTVTVTDGNGCQATAVTTIIVNPLPTPTITITETSGILDNDGILCEGDAAVLDGGTFTSYNWSTGELTQTITVTTAGDYTLIATDANGCEATVTTTITVNPIPTPIISAIETSGSFDNDGILCMGDDAVLNAGTYSAYQWSNGDVTQTITVNASGDYTVTCFDGNGCEGVATISILVNPVPVPNIMIAETSGNVDNDGNLCEGDIATLDAGPFSFYQWSTGPTTQAITVNASGDYTVTVTDGNGCEAIDVVTITVNPLPTLAIVVTETSGTTDDDGILCIGDAALLDGGTFTSYNWSTGETTQTITVTASGDYTLIVTDVNGCEAMATTTIVVNPLPAPAITGNTSFCFGECVALDAGTFSSYVWSSGETTQVIQACVIGDYTVTVTDGNGCENTSTINVDQFPVTTATITGTNEYCEGGNTVLTVGAFADYQWSSGAMTQAITVSGASATYTVTVTDANGCTATDEMAVTENPNPDPIITGVTAICNNGGDAMLDAGTYTSYVWSTGEFTQTITVTVVGTYSVTVTDANGCVGNTSVNVTATANPTPSITGTLDYCENSNTTLDAGTSYIAYEWSNGLFTQTIDVSGPSATYTVTVTDTNGCTGTDQVDVVQNTNPIPAITGNLVYCTGSVTVLTVDPNPDYVSYAWEPNGNITPNITVATGGTYTVTVTDINGCTGSTSVNVTEVPLPTVDVTTNTPIICLGGSATLDAGPGYATYNWSGGGVDQTFEAPSGGTYTVTITDGNGCQATNSINIATEPPLNIQVETPDDLTCDVQSVVLEANANGAVVYQWNTTGGFIESGADTNMPTVTSAGVYTVTAFTALGCPTSADVMVTMTPFTLADIYISTDTIQCYGDSTGVVRIDSIEGGIEPYLYDFNGSGTYTSQTEYYGLMSGTYTVNVIDAEGCEFSETIFIDQPPLVTLDLYPVDTLIHLGDSVQLQAFVNPTIPLSDTTWTETSWLSCTDCLDPWAAPLENTLYELIVTDTFGCSATATSLVRVENEQLIYIPNAFSPNNDGANDVFMIYGGQGVARVKSFQIFNRWGELIFGKSNFQPNDPSFGWNGTFRNKKLNPAVFVYYAEIEFINGRTEIFKGDVTLISAGE